MNAGVMPGFVPGISLKMALFVLIVGMAGTSPAMTHQRFVANFCTASWR
jgi:hypothetical protein